MYVWNIDRTPEYQIYDILNHMLTCVIAYESNGHSNGQAAMLLTNGLSGSLKLWWDHALTNEQKEAIRKHRARVKRIILKLKKKLQQLKMQRKK